MGPEAALPAWVNASASSSSSHLKIRVSKELSSVCIPVSLAACLTPGNTLLMGMDWCFYFLVHGFSPSPTVETPAELI